MTRTWGNVVAAGVTVALIDRDSGTEQADPPWPDQLHIVAGDSKVNLAIANMAFKQATSPAEAKISIDNIWVVTPTTPQSW